MKTYHYLLTGLIISAVFPALAANHQIRVNASLINAPCTVIVPSVIDFGEISTKGLNSKVEKGSINCTSPMLPRLQLSNAKSEDTNNVYFNTSKSSEGVEGQMTVTLNEEVVNFADGGCNRNGNGCKPGGKLNAGNNWEMKLTTLLMPSNVKDITPGEVSFSTTMSVNYD